MADEQANNQPHFDPSALLPAERLAPYLHSSASAFAVFEFLMVI